MNTVPTIRLTGSQPAVPMSRHPAMTQPINASMLGRLTLGDTENNMRGMDSVQPICLRETQIAFRGDTNLLQHPLSDFHTTSGTYLLVQKQPYGLPVEARMDTDKGGSRQPAFYPAPRDVGGYVHHKSSARR